MIQHYNADMTTNQLRHITNSRVCKINHCIRKCEMFWNLTIHIGTNWRGFQNLSTISKIHMTFPIPIEPNQNL